MTDPEVEAVPPAESALPPAESIPPAAEAGAASASPGAIAGSAVQGAWPRSSRVLSHARADHRTQAATMFALPADRLPWFMRLSELLGRSFVRCFTRVYVEGFEHVPRSGRLIIAANHTSNADPGVLAVWLTPALGRPVHWMAKAEALRWPVAGWFMRANGAFGVERGAADTEAYRLARRVLDEGRVLGTFPEGTRSPTGALQVAKNGVTLLALRTGAPILPVGIAGANRFWPRGRLLWRFGGRISLRIGQPFVLERLVGPDGGREPLEEATARLMARVAALLPERYRGVYDPAIEGVPTAPAGTEPTAESEAPGPSRA